MTLAKRFLLGSAAALVATTGAQAADLGLPVAPAVDYVQICSVAGMTGFILPGSDVCFDISGNVRFQAVFDADTDSGHEYDFNGDFELDFDARTMTEWGLLRGRIDLSGDGGDSVGVDKAYLQIGGLTAGFTDSFFDMVYTDYAIGGLIDGVGTGGGADLALFGYAYAVGNGVTIMASLEEGTTRQDEFYDNVALNDVVDYDADQGMPDVVVAVRVDQAWGSAKLSGAVFEVDPDDEITTPTVYDEEIGFAIGASAEFNLPVGVDSNFGIFGIYSDGSLGYVGAGDLGVDAVLNAAGAIDTTTAWSVGAGVEIGLNAMTDFELDAYYTSVDHDGLSVDADPTAWGVRGSIEYRPITNLAFRAGVGYSDIDADGLSGLDEPEDGAIAGEFRITRSF